MVKFTVLSLLIMASSCQPKAENKVSEEITQVVQEIEKPTPKDLQNLETAYFASGCFWCVEAIFESVRGVEEVVSGYSGGSEQNPTYKEVAYGKTSHAEAVKVYYDPEAISFFELVQVFFGSHDPTTLNRQGPDRGPHYRSIAFYKNEGQKKTITDYIALLESKEMYGDPIVTQVVPFVKFWEAEEYHQDYEKRNPNNSYIRAISVPRLNKFKSNFQKYLKEGAEVH